MSSHDGIGKIVFTGSASTGKKVMSSAAHTLKRLTLELGGNDAGIVLPDVDPKQIAPGLFWGGFINNGQTCAALKRLYVHDDVYDDVCKELVAFAKTVPMGDGLDDDSQLGPVQNRMQFDKVARLVEEAKRAGGKVLMGGEPEKGSLFYPITLIGGLDNGNPLVDEEQFGPALPIIRYSDIDEVIARANDNPNGLGGSVWSKDVQKAPRARRATANAARSGSTSTARSSRTRRSAASRAPASVSNSARKACSRTPMCRSCIAELRGRSASILSPASAGRGFGRDRPPSRILADARATSVVVRRCAASAPSAPCGRSRRCRGDRPRHPTGENVNVSNGSASIASDRSSVATPIVTCGLNFLPDPSA